MSDELNLSAEEIDARIVRCLGRKEGIQVNVMWQPVATEQRDVERLASFSDLPRQPVADIAELMQIIQA